ncbi:polysaccharide lyase family 8 super-sandwich domain-containing protein [Emticicia sp. C21]|uniref:polysaccharide lyase family 8 super-sandwich domain-containing protein n=1 Tax=Emticicia sp. C21 TaxID=2302915 RepID=UPI000E357D32|nr:polysaccharide lyase family 8 super-sandwich domain-containing protein [Emticicia sp. C21]RFS17203.1 hypothetical protein D0T08_05320 [Emticicia sp. C21]
MRSFLFLITLVIFSIAGFAQQLYYDFNSAVPANFSTTGVPLSLSNEHVKDGDNGLKWTAKAGTVLTANNLGISKAEIGNRKASSARLFIYSKRVTGDTLIFRFYDKAGVKQREGHMLVNYKGWRDYHRSYFFDYNNPTWLPLFELDRMEIVYKPVNPASTTTLYLDAFRIIGDAEQRVLGLHMKLDKNQFDRNATGILDDYLNTPDIGITAASETELRDALKVRAFYPFNIPSVSSSDLANAKKYVNACNIRRNADKSITGRGLFSLNNEDTLVQVSNYCAYLAQAAIKSSDTDAKNKLIAFTEYLVDQGLAEGAPFLLELGHYRNIISFTTGFLMGMSLYPEDLKSEVIKMLKWHVGYNIIYKTHGIDSDTDFMHLRSGFLFQLAALSPSPDIYVRDLKALSRYLRKFANFTEGSADGFKLDGCAFHHGVHYLGYMYMTKAYIDRIYSLKGTVYKLNLDAYKNLVRFIKASFLQSSEGMVLSNAESGRNPFQRLTISAEDLEKLIEIGGDIKKQTYDPELAELYNYIFNVKKYPVAKAPLDGYYQFNYGQLGVHRKDNWVAVMHGFTNRLFGAEIYPTQNRYGRYQSYGSLDVLYRGDTTACGYPKFFGSWDWNMPSGTTTVHLPFTELQAKQARADEYNKSSFAGALALGKNGIFAIDFIENAGNKYTPNHVKFHKSVFSFDGMLVCLGSGISSSNKTSTTATNIFQAVSASDNSAIYVNSQSAISDADYSQRISTANGYAWLVNGQTTGYFVPKGQGDIVVERGTQKIPLHSSLDGLQTTTTKFSKAYIDHGKSPVNAHYQFIIVPATTAKKIKALAAGIASGKVFKILSQTDTLHAVRSLPEKITSYVFFHEKKNVNIGYIKSISGEALVGIKESGDRIVVTINNPDLNTIDNKTSKWLSAPYKIDLQLAGNWAIVGKAGNVTINKKNHTLIASFILKDGLSETITLVKEKH